MKTYMTKQSASMDKYQLIFELLPRLSESVKLHRKCHVKFELSEAKQYAYHILKLLQQIEMDGITSDVGNRVVSESLNRN